MHHSLWCWTATSCGCVTLFGSSLGYQLASIIAGGPAPLIATWLFGTYHTSFAIAAYIAACAVLSLIATALMTDYTGKDIGGEYHA